ncbi:MAG: DUF3192 domain-containing protein [Pseudomonadota bacterium]
MTKMGLLYLSACTLTGCIYVNGERVAGDDWRDEQRDNRQAISSLEVGATRAEVVSRLGVPAESEAFTVGDDEVRVLFYRTQHKHSDGETTRDETTPLVFKNDLLTGWGNSIYDSLDRPRYGANY